MAALTKAGFGLAVFLAWMSFALSPHVPDPGPPDLSHAGLAVVKLRGEVRSQGDYLALPGQLAVMGNRLVILDRYSGYSVHVLRAHDGTVLRSFGRKGEGPGEFRAAWALAADPNDPHAFWIYDAALARMTRVGLDSGSAARKTTQPESGMIRLQAPGPLTGVAWLAPSRLVGVGFFGKGRLALFGADGRLVTIVAPLPELVARKAPVPVPVRQHAFQGTLQLSPDRAQIVVACRHASRIEIYRADGGLEHIVHGPLTVEPRFEIGNAGGRPVFVTGDALRFGYLDVAVTGDRIFALFSGRTRAGYPGAANYGEWVHAFTRRGDFLRAIHLDADVIAIAADSAGEWLYAVRHMPAPAILAYWIGG